MKKFNGSSYDNSGVEIKYQSKIDFLISYYFHCRYDSIKLFTFENDFEKSCELFNKFCEIKEINNN